MLVTQAQEGQAIERVHRRVRLAPQLEGGAGSGAQGGEVDVAECHRRARDARGPATRDCDLALTLEPRQRRSRRRRRRGGGGVQVAPYRVQARPKDEIHAQQLSLYAPNLDRVHHAHDA